MKHATTIRGIKGGVGTSTLAVLLTAELERRTNSAPVLLIERNEDCATIDGRPVVRLETQLQEYNPDRGRLLIASNVNRSAELVRVIDALEAFWGGEESPLVLVDTGTDYWEGAALDILTVRNDFLSLRRYIGDDNARSAALAVILEGDRPLGIREAQDITGVEPTAVLPHDLSIARSTDAGTLGMRTPKAIGNRLAELAELVITRSAASRRPKARTPEY